MSDVIIKDIAVGGSNPMVIIAGTCVIERDDVMWTTISTLVEITKTLGIPFIFKTSYDKANRTSIDSYRGPGLKKGLRFFERVKKRFSAPILTDVHCRHDLKDVASVVDCLQIPAYLCRQTDLLIEAGRTGLPVNIKKGQFMAPDAMKEAVKKVLSTGNENILLTERGISFGYNNLVVDFRGIPIMAKTGFPVIFDSTHSVQLPSKKGRSSGGDRAMVKYLSRAAVGVGVSGIFMEVHPNPARALSDGPNSMALKGLGGLLKELKELDGFIKTRAGNS